MYILYIYRIKFRMLEVRKNEIALRKMSGGAAHLRTLEGTLINSFSGSLASLSESTSCK